MRACVFVCVEWGGAFTSARACGSGAKLMEDFYYAGGLPAVMREMLPILDGGALTVNGRTVAENVRDAPCYNREVISTLTSPLKVIGRCCVLQ